MTTAAETTFDIALNMARQSLYRFGALALLDPRTGSWERLCDPELQRLVTDAADLLRDEPTARADPLAVAERPLAELRPAEIFLRLPLAPNALNAAYERVFGLLSTGACPACETEFIPGKFDFQRSNGLADVSGFYLAFGLTPSPQLPERQDHIVLELEFMAFLLGQERLAAAPGTDAGDERAAVCREAQIRFAREHLVWWVPAFAKLLAKEDAGGYYEAVGRFVAALMAAERALSGIPTPRVAPQPSTIETPDECDGCQLALGRTEE